MIPYATAQLDQLTMQRSAAACLAVLALVALYLWARR